MRLVLIPLALQCFNTSLICSPLLPIIRRQFSVDSTSSLKNNVISGQPLMTKSPEQDMEEGKKMTDIAFKSLSVYWRRSPFLSRPFAVLQLLIEERKRGPPVLLPTLRQKLEIIAIVGGCCYLTFSFIIQQWHFKMSPLQQCHIALGEQKCLTFLECLLVWNSGISPAHCNSYITFDLPLNFASKNGRPVFQILLPAQSTSHMGTGGEKVGPHGWSPWFYTP